MATILAVVLATTVEAEAQPTAGEEGRLSWYAGVSYDVTNWYNFEDVSGDDPSITSHDATTWSNGVGAYVGFRIPDTRLALGIGGHYARLETDTRFDGSRSTGEIDYYSLGGEARWMFGSHGRVQPYFGLGGLHSWNKGDFTLVDGTRTLDHRVHKTWTAEIGGGVNYWFRPRLAFQLGLNYNTTFEEDDADEHVRLSTGLFYNGGRVCGGQCGGVR